jgi:hypothetical protein
MRYAARANEAALKFRWSSMRERPPCVSIPQLTLINRELPIHEQINPGCQELGLLIGRRARIVPRSNMPTSAKYPVLRRPRSFRPGVFAGSEVLERICERQRDDLFVEDILAQFFRRNPERSPSVPSAVCFPGITAPIPRAVQLVRGGFELDVVIRALVRRLEFQNAIDEG